MSAAHCASCTVSEWGAGFGGFDQVVKGLVWGRSFYQHAVIGAGIVEDRRKVGNRIVSDRTQSWGNKGRRRGGYDKRVPIGLRRCNGTHGVGAAASRLVQSGRAHV